jgi:branched-chain amino acid transport system permease protein
VIGTVYGLPAAGLVLTYSTTGVLNLANGAIGYVVAEFFYWFVAKQGWDPIEAGAVCLLVIAPLIGFILWAVVFRRLEGAPLAVTLVSTVGLAVALPAMMRMALPHEQVFAAPGLIKDGFKAYHLIGLTITGHQLVAIVGGFVAIVLLLALLRMTPLGLTMRAVVDNKAVSSLVGTRTNIVSAAAWMLGSFLAGLAGILLAPILNIDAAVFTELTVASLSVALIGRLRSVGAAYAGGLGLGLLSALAIKYGPQTGVLAGAVRPALPFALLVILLLTGGRAIDATQAHKDEAATPPVPLPPKTTPLARGVRIGIAIVALSIPLFLTDYWNGILVLGVGFAVIFLSFSIAVGEGGLVPLGQAAIAGVGAFSAGLLVNDHGWPLLPAVVVGAVTAAAIGLVLGLIGLRLGRLGFGLLTLAFALFADRFLFRVEDLVPDLGANFGIPELFGFRFDSQRDLLYLFVVVFAIFGLAVWWLRRSGLGLYWGAMRSNAEAAECTGLRTSSLRIAAFVLASFIAGVGGSLIGVYQRNLGPESVAVLTGLVWVAVAVTIGARGVLAPLIAGLVYALLPAILAEWSGARLAELPVVLFGLGAVSLAPDPRGVVVSTTETIQGLAAKWRKRAPIRPTPKPIGALADGRDEA